MTSPKIKPKTKAKLKAKVSLPVYDGPYGVGITDFEVPASHLPSYYDSPDPKISTVHFAIFYPCEKPADNEDPQEPVQWIPAPQKQNMRAFSRFMGVSPRFTRFFSKFPRRLYKVTLPALRNATLKEPPNGRWPVVFFSHGIGGTRHTYSHLLGSLASYGVVVIAPDHRDGSGPFAHIRESAPVTPSPSQSSDIDLKSHRSPTIDPHLSTESAGDEDGSVFIGYQLIPHKFNDEVMRARRRQMKIRLWEMAMVYEAVAGIDLGNDILQPGKTDASSFDSESTTSSFSDILSRIGFAHKLEIHEPGKVVWAGHSFGAATVLQFVKTVYYSATDGTGEPSYESYDPLLKVPSDASVFSQINSQTQVSLLDMWTYPLLDTKTRWLFNKPLPSYNDSGPGGAAVLVIASDAFMKWHDNYRLVKKLISDAPAETSWQSNKPHPHFFYARFSAHLSQSDFGLLFPYLVKKVLKAKEPERLLALNVRSILQMMINNGAAVAPFKLTNEDYLKPKHIKEQKRPLPGADKLHGHHILSKTHALRNWVPVAMEEDKDLAFDVDKEYDLQSDLTFLPKRKG